MKFSILYLLLVVCGCFPFLKSQPMPMPYPSPEKGVRLTPPISDKPEINGAKIVGVTPCADFMFRIPTSGIRPMCFSVKRGLPRGLSLDKKTGIITGKVAKAGTYKVVLEAKNAKGVDTSVLTIKVGNDISLTPPMGWNSWYSYNLAVSQEYIEKTARLLDETGLVNHGWTYVNIDDCWQGVRGGKYNAIQGNERFPDLKKLCKDIHARGLKAGIYSTPWKASYAGYIGGTMDEDKNYLKHALPESQRGYKTQFFGSCARCAQLGLSQTGPVWMIDKDAKQWADWGFDYVKMDWKPLDVPSTQRMRNDLDKSGRDIILSLSNSPDLKVAEGLTSNTQCMRTTKDIFDTWESVCKIARAQVPWVPYTRPGYWNDPDILQVGRVGQAGHKNTSFKSTRLTADEQYFQVSMWSLLSAPLLISSDLENLDDFTKGLLMNDDIIAINQDSLGKSAQYVINTQDEVVVAKPLVDGNVAVGFFNYSNAPREITVKLSNIKECPSKVEVKDAWKRADVGTAKDEISVKVNSHGASVFILKRLK